MFFLRAAGEKNICIPKTVKKTLLSVYKCPVSIISGGYVTRIFIPFLIKIGNENRTVLNRISKGVRLQLSIKDVVNP